MTVIVVHDTEHEMTRAYRAGARAMRMLVPYNCCPHRCGSQAAYDWEAGHVNEGAGEHRRFGRDALRMRGRVEHDPDVPRDAGGDVDHAWLREQPPAH